MADPNGPVATGGTGATGGDVVVITAGTLSFGGSPGSGGKASGGNVAPVTTDQKSCNCSVPGGGKPNGRALLVLAAMLGLSRRRRNAVARNIAPPAVVG